ncbi:MAG: iron-containing alcohol dehydrogenase [Candidatus Izemoplasmataceae bacterium]
MINFIYHNPTKIIFGKDQIEALRTELLPYQGQSILLVYGKESIKKIGVYKILIKIFKDLKIKHFEESDVRANPSIESVISGRKTIIEQDIKFVLAAGGGSVIDAAKAIAFSPFVDEDKVWDVFLRKTDASEALPLGVVLTLAATGSEANGNTVITNDKTNEKRAVAYPFIFPRFAIIDPSYTMHVEKHFVIAGCIDIVMHVFEQFFSNTQRTETSDYMSMGIVKSVFENCDRYLRGYDSYETRANISWAATIGLNWILAQGKVGDWASHRLSYPITQFYGTTHGYALSTIYPAWLKTTLKHNPITMKQRLTFLGRELFNEQDPEKVIDAIQALLRSWGAPTSFEEAGIQLDDASLEKLVSNALALGNVGTVVSIDKPIARELFERAK